MSEILIERNIELQNEVMRLKKEYDALERARTEVFEARYRDTISALVSESTEIKNDRDHLKATLERYEEKYDYLSNALYELKRTIRYDAPDYVPYVNEMIDNLHNKHFKK